MKRRAIEAPDFVVDDVQGAMLNTNTKALESYKKTRAHNRQMRTVASRVEKLEASMSNIELLLTKLLEKQQ